MEWNGGMERWNGMEWNSGMTTPTECVFLRPIPIIFSAQDTQVFSTRLNYGEPVAVIKRRTSTN